MLVLATMLYSCASMGRPSGGPRDYLPPIFVGSSPAQGEHNVMPKRVEIEFDELVQLKDQNDKVVVSPSQKQNPTIRTSGRKVVVEFKDSLMPNTTYSIDFADAIQDFNESNPIDAFSFAFSTGDSIDSLQISGILLDAHTLEPQQKMLVGVHTNLDDTAFTTIPLERIARTNDRGQFTIRNLKTGRYRLFAINDVDRDMMFANPAEDIAFFDTIIEPTTLTSLTTDTIRKINHEIDTVVEVMATQYLPNDVLLSMFNEDRRSQYLVKYERQDSTKLFYIFGAPADSLPKLEILEPKPATDNWCTIDHSPTNDTITYWLRDPAMISSDTIRVATTYLRTDSAQNLSLTTDTLIFKAKRDKAKKKEKKKKKKNDEENDSVKKVEIPTTPFVFAATSSQEINLPIRMRADVPLDSISPTALSIAIQQDSDWVFLSNLPIVQDREGDLKNYHADFEWEPGMQYRVTIDSASVRDIYGLYCKRIEATLAVKKLEEYSDLVFNVNAPDSSFIELLDGGDKAVRVVTVENGTAVFNYLAPNTYYARLIIDTNRNGKWDTGNFAEHRQPEDVYYYNKALKLKKNWEITENWDINSLPVDMQKPEDIKKNKPEKKKWEQDKLKKKKGQNDDEEDEENFYDPNNPYSNEGGSSFGTNQFQNGQQYNNRNRRY